MNIHHVEKITGAFVVEVDRFYDDRGFFQEVFSRNKHEDLPGISQVNISQSYKNVVRGLHVAPFSKLCTCIRGRLFDVVADVRRGSPTFGNWYGVWLDENNHKQLFVPSGCAHGFFAAENDTILLYQQDGLYRPDLEKEVHWQDPTLAVEWPKAESYIVSIKDQKAPCFEDFLNVKL